MQTIFFLGRSGSGKGVQSGLLQEYLKAHTPDTPVFYVETGAHFREHVKKEGYTWDRAREVNATGGRQPDFLAVWAWSNHFVNEFHAGEHLVFDGSPRSLNEARIMDTLVSFYERKKPTIFFLDVSRETVERRLEKRGRPDDLNPEAVAKRLAWYEEDVVPAIEYYKTNPAYTFIRIDGEQTPEEVHAAIVKELTTNNRQPTTNN